MSRSVVVKYRDSGFWAYDVALGVFLKHLIDVAVPRAEGPTNSWLADAVEQWRLYACVSDFGFKISDEWSANQIELFSGLCEEACRQVATREWIDSEEIKAWPIHDYLRIDPRDEAGVPSAPVVRLGWAIVGLVKGTLELPPTGYLFFDLTDQPRVIESR